ncbi:MAG: toxin-antitoxin system HicB family antitoxin [Methylobacter tundripaludum]|nr:toxin-antitoxin system HicB family antitoxin [Methylobacter tundripaludum]
MTQLSITIPDSIYNGVRTLAAQENISIDQFVALALGEKVSALMTEDYLLRRAQRGRRDKFLAVLDAAPNIDPIEEDRIGQ